MITGKGLRKFVIYTLVSILGMFASRYVPEELFYFWCFISLLIGHIINLKNYK